MSGQYMVAQNLLKPKQPRVHRRSYNKQGQLGRHTACGGHGEVTDGGLGAECAAAAAEGDRCDGAVEGAGVEDT